LINGKSYYQVLGVLDDAEDIVIRAAYKSLAAKYHPDKWSGDKQFANARMTEINIAHDCLSNSEKRRIYDEELKSSHAGAESKKFEDEEQFDTFEEDAETWDLAVEFYPNLQTEYKNLSRINKSLANTYKIYLIKHQLFNKHADVSKEMAERYLEKYFGSSPETRKLAKDLLIRGEHKVARYLNDIVTKLGKSVSYSQIQKLLLKKFPMEMHAEGQDKDEIEILWRRIESKIFSEDDALKAIRFCGYQAARDGSLFGTFYMVHTVNGVSKKMNSDELIRYVKDEIFPLAVKNGWV